jgi:hypothetical protein
VVRAFAAFGPGLRWAAGRPALFFRNDRPGGRENPPLTDENGPRQAARDTFAPVPQALPLGPRGKKTGMQGKGKAS